MKVIELGHAHPTLDEIIDLAEEEIVVLRKPDGSVFALSPVDEFAVEVELLKQNREFMALLKQLLKNRRRSHSRICVKNWLYEAD